MIRTMLRLCARQVLRCPQSGNSAYRERTISKGTASGNTVSTSSEATASPLQKLPLPQVTRRRFSDCGESQTTSLGFEVASSTAAAIVHEKFSFVHRSATRSRSVSVVEVNERADPGSRVRSRSSRKSARIPRTVGDRNQAMPHAAQAVRPMSSKQPAISAHGLSALGQRPSRETNRR